MEREEVIREVSKILAIKKIHPAFHPIVKEFFARAAQQDKWTKKDLQKAFDSFEYLQGIQFKNMKRLVKGRNKFFVNSSKGTIENNIVVSIEYLKGILTYDVDKIEEFINLMMHELGHSIKMKNTPNSSLEVGIQLIHKITGRNIQGNIINEFAEIIWAKRLQKGNYLDRKYDGYPHMQSAVRAVIYALGLTEEKLCHLQWQGRKAYEDAVFEELEETLDKTYLFSFETILDRIHVNYMGENKANVIAQVKEFNSLINQIFRARIQALKGKEPIQYLAKLDAEQTMCHVALQDMLTELGIEAKVQVGVRSNLLESGMTDSMIDRIREEADILLEERDTEQKKEAKFYDNTQLIEEIYEGFSKYPMRLLPIFKIPEIIRIKIAGKIARIAKLEVSSENDEITSTSEETYTEKHRRFVKRIVNLARCNAVQFVNSTVQPRKEKGKEEYEKEE